MNDEIRLQRRARLMDNQVYQSMQSFTRYMDRFYLDAVIGLIPFFIGDVIDIFHRANMKNMAMIQGFIDGDEAIIKQVNRRALQSAIVLLVLLLLIALMIWALVSFGSYLYSLIASV